MSKLGRWPGTWRFICDECGMEYSSHQAKHRWDGAIVCPKDWEPRHPADLMRVTSKERALPWSRPEGQDLFTDLCDINTSSGYAGMGVAGCMQAGNTTYTYQFLLDLNRHGHGD